MAAEEGDVGKPKRQLRRALGLDDYGELWLPRKRSSAILAGIEHHRERGCWFDFRHGRDTNNATLLKNRRS